MPGLAERRILVDGEADAVTERELEALVRVVARAGALRAMPGHLEHLAGDGVQLAAGDPGPHRVAGPLERLAHEAFERAHGRR